MIEEQATVTQLHLHSVTVESHIKSTCSQCQQVDSCGSGQVAKALPHKKLSLEIPTALKLNIDDQVIIAIPEKYLLRTAWQVYLWPLIGLIFAAGIGQLMLINGLFNHEIFVILLSIIGGVLGHKLVVWWQNYTNQNEQLIPKITKVIPKDIIRDSA